MAVGIAEDKVAEQLAAKGRLSVFDGRHAGFPFLTGVSVAGRYDDVRISLTAEELGQPAAARRADIALTACTCPVQRALRVGGEGAGRPRPRDGDAVLRAARGKLGGNTTWPGGGRLRISKSVERARVHVAADRRHGLARRQPAGGGREKAAGAGVDVPGFLVSRVSDLLDLRYDVPALRSASS